MPRRAASSTIKGHQVTGIDPRRFISLAVDGFAPMARENSVAPPKPSIRSETVRIMPMRQLTEFLSISSTGLLSSRSTELLFMSNQNERLRQARISAGFKSARAAANRFGWTPSTYASHENGQTSNIPTELAAEYAAAFKTSAAWLLTGEGERQSTRRLKIHGVVSAGGVIQTDVENIDGHDGLGEIEVPFPLPEGVMALQVTGESMWPRYDPGDIIICLTRHRAPEELLGFEACVITDEGNRYLKRLTEANKKGLFNLESFNAAPIKSAKVTRAMEVHSVVRVGQWRKLDAGGRKRAIARALKQ